MPEVSRPAIYRFSLNAAITPISAKTTIAEPMMTYRQTLVGEPTAARSCCRDSTADGGFDSPFWICEASASFIGEPNSN